jgi:hypothetical protein
MAGIGIGAIQLAGSQEHRNDRAILSLRAGLHDGRSREARSAVREAEKAETN